MVQGDELAGHVGVLPELGAESGELVEPAFPDGFPQHVPRLELSSIAHIPRCEDQVRLLDRLVTEQSAEVFEIKGRPGAGHP